MPLIGLTVLGYRYIFGLIMPYPFEPYKTKVLEPIKTLNRTDRIKALKGAHYNLFKIPSEKVTIDLLTDSGTSALSQEQLSQTVFLIPLGRTLSTVEQYVLMFLQKKRLTL